MVPLAMGQILSFCGLCIALIGNVSFAASDTLKTEQLKLSLIRGPNLKDGAFEIGVRFDIKDHWHVYWKNPGDSGSAPKFNFQVEGAEIGSPLWPLPERIAYGELTNYGYSGSVIIPFRVAPKPGIESVHVSLDIEWLVCEVKCIPGFGKLAASFPINDARNEFPQDLKKPRPIVERDPQLFLVDKNAQGITLALEAEKYDLKKVTEIDLFPESGTLFVTERPKWEWDGKRWLGRVNWAANAERETRATNFLLMLRDPSGTRAIEKSVALNAIPWDQLYQALLLAFLGGVLLNFMPCVFPVLSLKVLSFLREENLGKKTLVRSGWLYCLGVVVSFLVLAGVLLILRAGGEQLGWGFQLQSPRFVLAMALLFFLISLNFLGVFDVGDNVMNLVGRIQSAPVFSSSFGMGVLATFVATPCTAPFMGSAVGLSLLLPPAGALLIFASLGFGMAMPFVLLCYFPSWVKKLPRPGRWMEHFKQFLAFPMLATVIWLGWVLLRQSGDLGFLLFSGCLLGVSFSLWLFWLTADRIALRGISLFILFLSVGGALWFIQPTGEKQLQKAEGWAAYDREKIESALAKGDSVFIDFTAAWCLTCQWNKRSVLHTDSVLKLFKENRTQLVQADWTHRDPTITQALALYGRNSVPVYVFLKPGESPVLLPELLTTASIEMLFSQGRKE